MLVQNFDVVAGDFAACEGIDVSANGVALDGDLSRGAVACAFEKGVLDKMGDAVKRSGFVARARSHPNPDGCGSNVIHSFRNNCKAVIEDCLSDGTCLLDHIAPGRDASTRVEGEANEGSDEELFCIFYLRFSIFYLPK